MLSTTFVSVHVGPMFSSKSQQLIIEMEKIVSVFKQTHLLIYTHGSDVRPSLSAKTQSSEEDKRSITSHSSIVRSGCLGLPPSQTHICKTNNLFSTIVEDIDSILSDIDDNPFISAICIAISIDEASFFNKDDLVKSVRDFSDPRTVAMLFSSKSKIKVYISHIFVAGLIGTFYQTPFPDSGIFVVMAMADKIQMHHAICEVCAQESGTSVPAPFTIRTAPIPQNGNLIGGSEAYSAVCRRHISHPPII